MDLIKFIKRLSVEEDNVIGAAFRPKNGRQSQEGELYELLRNCGEEELTDAQIKERLSQPLSDQALTKLKSRVFLKILDKMSSDEFIQNNAILDTVDRAEIRLKKKLLQLKILHLKTAKTDPETFLHLINEILHEAKEYELYDSMVEALSYKKSYYGVRAGYKEFRQYQDEIELYRACSALRSQANDFYTEIVSNKGLISHFSERELMEYIDEKIKFLESSPYTTLSTRVQYFYKVLKLAQCQYRKQHAESIDICLEIISLLKRSKAIGRSERIGIAYGNLTKCLIYQRHYKQAAQTAHAAQIHFAPESLSFVLIQELEFFASFYSNNYLRCRELINMMLNHNQRHAGKIRLDLFTYYLGCLEFAEGKFHEAKQISNLSLEILKDKMRWDLGIRYLKIMSQVELGETEEARDAIEALRKQLKRTTKDGKREISKRDEFIFKALHEFAMCDFKTSSSKLAYALKKLSLKETVYGWKLFTHEVMPVHRWIKKRLRVMGEKPGNLLSMRVSA